MMRALLAVGAVAVIGLGALWLGQRRLIYLPSGVPGPAPAGWEAATIRTVDGLGLGAWFHPPRPGEAVVVVFNGNAGHRGDRIGLGTGLAAHGLGVVLFDYRGYGGNEGTPSESGLAADAQAINAWVRQHTDDADIVFFGESLGAAVAINLAAERPPDALVLRSPFSSLANVAAEHYPFLPVRALLWDDFQSLERIAAIQAPLTVIAGSRDSIIPPSQSRAIHDAAPGPKRWLLIEDADHNDTVLVQGEAVVGAVVDAVRP